MRARHHSRWWSNGLKKVYGAVQYAAEESKREGEFYDHVAKGQLPARAHELVVGEYRNTAAVVPSAAHTTFGTDLARTLFALPTTLGQHGRGAPPFSGVVGVVGGGGGGGGGGAASASASADEGGGGGFTFGSLLSGSAGDYNGGADAPPTPHKFRV
tara:strand:+ start:272 stop:742 length:471 start_codon:yes stop_codon:yes gene_type:complete